MANYFEMEINTQEPVYLSGSDIVHEMTLEIMTDKTYEAGGAIPILNWSRASGK